MQKDLDVEDSSLGKALGRTTRLILAVLRRHAAVSKYHTFLAEHIIYMKLISLIDSCYGCTNCKPNREILFYFYFYLELEFLSWHEE
jgi:hypothetical protein